jgi:hypothetical protein
MSQQPKTLTVYSFADQNGKPLTWTTMNGYEAYEHAEAHGLRTIKTVFAPVEAGPVPEWDFTLTGCRCCSPCGLGELCDYCAAVEEREEALELVTA